MQVGAAEARSSRARAQADFADRAQADEDVHLTACECLCRDEMARFVRKDKSMYARSITLGDVEAAWTRRPAASRWQVARASLLPAARARAALRPSEVHRGASLGLGPCPRAAQAAHVVRIIFVWRGVASSGTASK